MSLLNTHLSLTQVMSPGGIIPFLVSIVLSSRTFIIHGYLYGVAFKKIKKRLEMFTLLFSI